MTPLQKIRQHPLILPFYLPTLLVALSLGIQEPILPLYAGEFGVAYGLIGVVLSGQSLGMLLTDLPGGMLLQRLGMKRTMLLGTGIATVASLGLFVAPTIPVVLFLRIFVGVGLAMLMVSRHSYITDQVAISERGRTIALFGGLNRIGRFGGPLIGGLVGEIFGLNVPFLVVGGVMAVSWVVLAVFMEDSPIPEANKAHGALSFRLTKAQLRPILTGGTGMFFAQMVRTGSRSILPLYAADVIGLDVSQIGLLSSIGAGIDMTLFYPAGYVMDKFGRKFAIVPSFMIQGIGLALIPLTHSFVSLAVVAVIIGIANGFSSGTMMTVGSDLAPLENRGEFLGLWRLISDSGFTVGPLLVGGIATALTLSISAVALGSSGIIATLIFWRLVPETRK